MIKTVAFSRFFVMKLFPYWPLRNPTESMKVCSLQQPLQSHVQLHCPIVSSEDVPLEMLCMCRHAQTHNAVFLHRHQKIVRVLRRTQWRLWVTWSGNHILGRLGFRMSCTRASTHALSFFFLSVFLFFGTCTLIFFPAFYP